MKIRAILFLTMLLVVFGSGQVFAGYWFDSSGSVWRSSAGECWRTGYWTRADIIVGCDGRMAEPAATPAPAPDRAVAPAAPTLKTAEATVGFGFDRADLDATATAALEELLTRVKGLVRSVRLTGHADRIGTDEYNLDLSLRRASAVSDYLTQRIAIDPQKIEISGKGESEPLVGCEGVYGAAAIRCLAPNRRVDVMFDMF